MGGKKREEVEQCSCTEALFYREKLKEIIKICTTDTHAPMVVDLARIANTAAEALDLKDFDGEGL